MNHEAEIRVWDPFVRIFHWSLAAVFFTAWLTGDDFIDIHTLAGYTALALVLTRIPWGFIGGRHARFNDFIRPPRAAFAYARDTLRGRAPRYIGHNPAGGLMIVLFLALIPLTALSGMAVLGAEEGAGPLAGLLAGSPHWLEEFAEEAHEFLANTTLFLVLIHIAGVIVEGILHRENLVRAMVTGCKPVRVSRSA